MAVSVSYPGVYIQEFAPGAPIQGVGTSTAAFIGVAEKGPINSPRFVASFDAFQDGFGDEPMDGYYLWYAVRGFFQNGGQRAYVVRASSGERASETMPDRRSSGTPQTALVATAREPGVPSPQIDVTVSDASLASAEAYRTSGDVEQADGDRIKLKKAEDAATFREEDQVTIDDGTNEETREIANVNGALITVSSPLGESYSGGTLRLADLASGDTVVRMKSGAADLSPGSVIQLSQSGDSEVRVVREIALERISPQLVTYRVTLEDGLTNTYGQDPGEDDPIAVESQEFSLTVSQGSASDTRSNLSMARKHSRYVGTVLAAEPFELVTLAEPDVPSNAPLPERRPKAQTYTLAGGAAADPAQIKPKHYQDALDALRDVDDVNFIAIPDSTDVGVQMALLAHCEEMWDRVAIFDPPAGLPATGPGSVRDRVALLRSADGFGALYYPWISIPHPDGGTVSVPPSGHVAGVYARADSERGVHKAPANYTLSGALGVMRDMNNETQGVLNLDNINVLRVFPGQARPVVWGARTTSPPDLTTWQYINIRRLFLFIEESIEEGIRWAVFEPNNQQLWQKLKRTITEFLARVWRDGALFGTSQEEAFYVRIDEALNPPSVQALGRLNIEIGVRPAYPAEFIVVRIGIWRGGSETSES